MLNRSTLQKVRDTLIELACGGDREKVQLFIERNRRYFSGQKLRLDLTSYRTAPTALETLAGTGRYLQVVFPVSRDAIVAFLGGDDALEQHCRNALGASPDGVTDMWVRGVVLRRRGASEDAPFCIMGSATSVANFLKVLQKRQIDYHTPVTRPPGNLAARCACGTLGQASSHKEPKATA